MAAEISGDDVIRIRIDTASAVAEFLRQLAEQAAEGETVAPANPANRAIFREIAPFRLVEYGYVHEGLGDIEGAYLGFPDGTIYAVTEDVPEEAVDGLIAASPDDLQPVYVYILLARPHSPGTIDRFLKSLSGHVGKPLVGVYRDESGRMAAYGYDGDDPAAASAYREELEAAVVRSALEADRHPGKARVLRQYHARHDTLVKAYARVGFDYGHHLLEFAGAEDRDNFLAWTKMLCAWIYARPSSWEAFGFTQVMRPADPVTDPEPGALAVRLSPPVGAWQAFEGVNAATARRFEHAKAGADPAALERALELARDYWNYVTSTVAGVEGQAKALEESRRKRQLKRE
ncbi:hypothetical protein [Magnetospirillum sp. UT-4]|uniref:hypothetical protein n=1 Tax=Magnetospirillum sp. UT-4 TaxID=2681467 RepID=UPI0013827C81|nr:hypothetical protein [Magnetospirillum sp. UT-4]CAA7625218.1 conserved hypothetical protein [Magnetospirillum sp. UT-4]